ncbi:hypothetical protein BDV11DRAFT_200965 [Aspergillus similis]
MAARAFIENISALTETIVYRMTPPLGTGPVWDAVRPRAGEDGNKVIVVVTAAELRASGVDVSCGISWEKTCEDFMANLGSNGKLDTLVTCEHLIVLFGCDGAIYHNGRQMVEPVLFFDPLCQEGDFEARCGGPVPGFVEAFVAGLTADIVQGPSRAVLSLEKPIHAGLAAARRLTTMGFQYNAGLGDGNPPGRPEYPVSRTMEREYGSDIAPTARTSIPSESIAQGSLGQWSILGQEVGDPIVLAHSIVRDGTSVSTEWFPTARFGELTVVDRADIQSCNLMFKRIKTYLGSRPKAPLNIGVLGKRGSGRSFAALQVATAAAIACDSEVRFFEIYLTASSHYADILRLLEEIRETTIAGRLPLVYLDASDDPLASPPPAWISQLLFPLLQGIFQDHGVTRRIGHSVFLLASSLSALPAAYNSGLGAVSTVPDVLGCLHGYVNFRGCNRLDETDVLYSVRRGVVLRKLLEEREPALQQRGKISVDDSVLDGLLLSPTYRNGYSSLKAIIATSDLSGKQHFDRALLPPEAQLRLHVDYAIFARYAQFNVMSDDLRESLAEGLHDTYKAHRLSMAKTDEERERLQSQDSMSPWYALDEEFRESARAHAVDIPRKLRVISCYISKEDSRRSPVKEFTHDDLELLAEMEHERWNAERLQRQWRLGQRDAAQRTSPFLVPWRDLAVIWQDIDRVMVGAYLRILPQGYAVYRTGRVKNI